MQVGGGGMDAAHPDRPRIAHFSHVHLAFRTSRTGAAIDKVGEREQVSPALTLSIIVLDCLFIEIERDVVDGGQQARQCGPGTPLVCACC